MKKSEIIFQIIIYVFFIGKLYSQDIKQVIESKTFDFSGNLSAGFSFNTSNNDANNFAPLSYRVSFNPIIKVKGFSLPFRFMYIDSDFSVSGPTVRLGFNPKYKWVQLYTGSNSFTLSPLTFSGQNVNGIGLELNPKNFRLLGFYGKLQNFTLQREVFDFNTELLETFKRNVFGIKSAYNLKFLDLEISGAKIIDDSNNVDDAIAIKPMENIVLGSKISSRITSKINVGGEIALSILTEDRLTNEQPNNTHDLLNVNFIKSLIRVNESTRLGFAGSTFVNFRVAKQRFGLNYKRVAPNYQSLGLFYINEDYQNITFTTTLRLLKNKLRINSTIGKQNNNLNNLKTSESIRTIGSINANYQISKPLSLYAAYSNQTQDRQNTILSDDGSLQIGQTSESFSINPRYLISNKKYTKSYTINLSRFNFQRIQDDFKLEEGSSENNSINANYSLNHKINKWGVRIGANYFSSLINENESKRYGLTAGYNKTIQDKLRLSVSTTFNKSESTTSGNTIINLNRLNGSYKITKKQNLNLSLLQSNGILIADEKTSRFRMNLAYAFNF